VSPYLVDRYTVGTITAEGQMGAKDEDSTEKALRLDMRRYREDWMISPTAGLPYSLYSREHLLIVKEAK